MMSTEVLQLPTLVLNRHWQPIHVTSVVRALVLLWNDSARVVEPDEYRLYTWDDWAALEPEVDLPCIRAARLRLRVPEVVSLTHYDRLPSTAVTFSRRNVARRDHFTCQYCGAQPGAGAMTIDHVIPRSQGGASTWTNCVAACETCNARKADRSPDQAGMRLRKRPARPEWKPLYAGHGARVASWDRFVSHAHEPALVTA
jgi:5-methylcytosine-specific restriction endonuclease McrA